MKKRLNREKEVERLVRLGVPRRRAEELVDKYLVRGERDRLKWAAEGAEELVGDLEEDWERKVKEVEREVKELVKELEEVLSDPREEYMALLDAEAYFMEREIRRNPWALVGLVVAGAIIAADVIASALGWSRRERRRRRRRKRELWI